METTGVEPALGRCKAARAAFEHYVPNLRAEVGYAASALFLHTETIGDKTRLVKLNWTYFKIYPI